MLSGGFGFDFASYEHATAGVIAFLTPVVNTGEAAGDSYTFIDGLIGSAFGDLLIGDSNNNTLKGLAGDDYLYGLNGNDLLIGGAGADYLDGGLGFDFVSYEGAVQPACLRR